MSRAGRGAGSGRIDLYRLGVQALARGLTLPFGPQGPVAGGQDEGPGDRGWQRPGGVPVDGPAGFE